jgi:hypothetical protein
MTRQGVLRGAATVGLVVSVLVVSFGAAWLVDDPESRSGAATDAVAATVRRELADRPAGTFRASDLRRVKDWDTLRVFAPGTPRWRMRMVLPASASLPELVPADETLLAFAGRNQVHVVAVPASAVIFRCIAEQLGLSPTARLRVVLADRGVLNVLPSRFRISRRGRCETRIRRSG